MNKCKKCGGKLIYKYEDIQTSGTIVYFECDECGDKVSEEY